MRKPKNYLCRVKQPKKRKTKLIAAFDIETVGLGGEFIEGCISYEDKPGEHPLVSTSSSLFDTILCDPGYIYYAHNGGGYDFCYLIDHILRIRNACGSDGRVDPIRQGTSRIIGFKITIGKKRYDIRDSFAIIPTSLRKAADFFAPDLPKSDAINFEAGEVYNPNNPLHREYLYRDCDALIAVVKSYANKVRELFGTELGYTAGSTAMNAWQAYIPEGFVYWRLSKKNEEWARVAYYGGYVHPGYEIGPHGDVISIDLNAAYAASMRKGVPVGNPFGTYKYYPDMFGIYEVIAHVPHDIPFPIIPSRDSHGMLQWCSGTFRTRITSTEIEFAKQRGCSFDILEGLVWEKWEYPFDEFLNKCEKMELEGGVLKEIAKLQRNALYGRFGTKLEQESIVLSEREPGEHYAPVIDEQTGEPKWGLWTIRERCNPGYIQRAWAATITMHQRLKLFELMEGVGIEHFRYADTDSIKGDARAVEGLVSKGLVSVQPGYGHVKVDERYEWFECLGVKNYRGIKVDGSYVGKTKGIPKRFCTPELMEQASRLGISEKIYFRGMNAPMQLLLGKKKEVSMMRNRRIGSLVNSQSWRVHDGKIRPVHIVHLQ